MSEPPAAGTTLDQENDRGYVLRGQCWDDMKYPFHWWYSCLHRGQEVRYAYQKQAVRWYFLLAELSAGWDCSRLALATSYENIKNVTAWRVTIGTSHNRNPGHQDSEAHSCYSTNRG